KNILVTGANGLLGRALLSTLEKEPYNVCAPSSKELNLNSKENVDRYIANNKIDCVYHLAARVGGVKANTEFVGNFYDQNIAINTNVLSACLVFGIPKVVSVLSTCVYPDAPYVSYPLTEDQLHLGPPHDSNFGYAYAKRMLDVQTRAYRKQFGVNYVTVIPNNMFGKYDNFHLENSHVLPALIRKIWEAKLNNHPTVEIWGDGSPLREFTYADDIARILVKVSEEYDEEHPLNIGNTEEHSIASVVKKIVEYLEYDGKIVFNTSKPSGQFRKPSSNKRLLEKTSWRAEDYTPFDIALKKTCDWFKIAYPNVRGI
ncbi:MAG: GDP-L-fucose synthase, partial [Proteobacteria bacterium]|nr:GDP-L-fucose synthase [Pseudomonadota bacterium]